MFQLFSMVLSSVLLAHSAQAREVLSMDLLCEGSENTYRIQRTGAFGLPKDQISVDGRIGRGSGMIVRENAEYGIHFFKFEFKGVRTVSIDFDVHLQVIDEDTKTIAIKSESDLGNSMHRYIRCEGPVQFQ